MIIFKKWPRISIPPAVAMAENVLLCWCLGYGGHICPPLLWL